MSRAFVKEDDQPEDDGNGGGDLPLSPHPNYITPQGLSMLRERLDGARGRLDLIADQPLHAGERSSLQRELRWLQARIGAAIVVEEAQALRDRVAFGATVDIVERGSETTHRYRIVGEDEADPAHGLLSWISPLAVSLTGAMVGDVVTWQRPAGGIDVEIVAIDEDLGPA